MFEDFLQRVSAVVAAAEVQWKAFAEAHDLEGMAKRIEEHMARSKEPPTVPRWCLPKRD